MSQETLRISKDGKLIQVYFAGNETGEDVYKEKDVTDSAIRRLWDHCELEDGVTLKSIFTLLNTELAIFDTIIGNWCKEIVTEGLSEPEGEYTGQYDPEGMEYLELYFHLQKGAVWDAKRHDFDPNITVLEGTKRADLHGIGWELKENKYHDWNDDVGNPAIEWPKGERIPWSVSFQKTNALINHPVKLKQETILHDDASTWRKPRHYNHEPITTFQQTEFTLGDILYGIIWELSFYGAPEKRDAQGEELLNQVKDIKEGKGTFKDFFGDDDGDDNEF